jgi:glycerophosphoryl diester phosphodiesterase
MAYTLFSFEHTPATPRIMAHRGFTPVAPENSLPSFEAAGKRGFWAIETDVHRTGDGQFVVIHDDTTKRVGIDNLVVEETTYETLRALHLADKDGQRGRNDLRIPSLLEYTQICKKYGKVSVLELKNHFEPADVDKIIEIIRGEEWLENTIFISFDLDNLIYLRSVLPEQPAQYLISRFTDDLMDILIKNNLDLDIYHGSLTKDELETFISILCPFAPHICEEMWEELGHKNVLSLSEWPAYDEAKTVDATIEIAVQICGKLRSTIRIAADADKDAAIAAAKADEKIVAALDGKTIVKEIYVPGKIINIVVK